MSQVQNLLLELHNERTLKEQFLRERNEYRLEARNERELSESIVAEREKLYLQVEEMQKTVNEFPVSCKLDEDIPDDDKEAAYKMGYADAIADIAESIKALKGEFK